MYSSGVIFWGTGSQCLARVLANQCSAIRRYHDPEQDVSQSGAEQAVAVFRGPVLHSAAGEFRHWGLVESQIFIYIIEGGGDAKSHIAFKPPRRGGGVEPI